MNGGGGGGGGGMLEYDMPLHAPQPYAYIKAPYSHSTHSRWEEKNTSLLSSKPLPDPADPRS